LAVWLSRFIRTSCPKLSMERLVCFQPGPLGMYFQDGGVIRKVDPAGPAGLKGVLPGMCIIRVGNQDVAGQEMRAILTVLMKTKSGGKEYTMTFSEAPRTPAADLLEVDSEAVEKKPAGYSAGHTVVEEMIAKKVNDSEMRSFLVDNSELKSGARGLGYRSAPSLGMMDPRHEMAPWGSIVQGVPQGHEWVKLGPTAFLPISISGKAVLKESCDLPA